MDTKETKKKTEYYKVPSRSKSEEASIALPDDVLKKLAVKYNKPTHIIEFIIREEFRQAILLAKRKDMPRILLHYLGSFEVSKKRKQTILYYRNRLLKRIEDDKNRKNNGGMQEMSKCGIHEEYNKEFSVT